MGFSYGIKPKYARKCTKIYFPKSWLRPRSDLTFMSSGHIMQIRVLLAAHCEHAPKSHASLAGEQVHRQMIWAN